jgi:ABC-type multidrug transport system fused ATPase/permease subunit
MELTERELLKEKLQETRYRMHTLSDNQQSEIDNFDFIKNKFTNNIIIILSLLFGVEAIITLVNLIPFSLHMRVFYFFIFFGILVCVLFIFQKDFLEDKKGINKRFKEYQNELEKLSQKEKEIVSKLNNLK